ncbi:hypothetical protein FOZ61_002483 [Perkinsus olseni]|uniref:Uncharacterized protein n=1 Tax=Perkinsus olseni TaxID=32597 RepID=A0A7J6MEA4_PEROL|nr:hypothetical protein FOZ61_002483 [Perkinsus olseni]KAF4675562.1 hypothetical protein FOL46_001089 [Perkinsus olseni]
MPTVSSQFLNFTGSATLAIIATRLWLHSTALLYTVRRPCALTSGPKRGHGTKDPLEQRWRSPGRGATPTGGDAVAGFPPAGIYRNKRFGIVVEIKGIDNCTFTFNTVEFTLPYSRMAFDESEGTFKCYIPNEDEEIHHLGRALRHKIGLKGREPLKPSHVRLCHSVEDGRTWMKFPSGPVPLERRKPLPSLRSGKFGIQQPRDDGIMRTSGDEVDRAVRPRSPSQTDLEDRKRAKRALDDSRETVLGRAEMKEPPRKRSGGTEIPRDITAHGSVRRPELSYMGYATGNPLDILAIASLSTSAESYKEGSSHSVGIVNQPIPGQSVGVPARPVRPNPAVAPHEAPVDVPSMEAVATSAGREEAGGGRVSGTEMGVLGDENRRRSGQGQKLAYVSPNRAVELSQNPNGMAKTVRGMTWNLPNYSENNGRTTSRWPIGRRARRARDPRFSSLQHPQAKEGYLDCGEDSGMDLLASETGFHESNSDHAEHSSLINIGNETRQATMGAEVDSIYAASSGGERWTDRVASDSVSSEDEFYFEDLLKWFEDSTPDGPSDFDKI